LNCQTASRSLDGNRPLPPIRLSECEVVIDTEKFIRSTLRQSDAHLSGKKSWLSGNWPLPILHRRLQPCGCAVVIDDRRMV
jgi:hypothetical protein